MSIRRLWRIRHLGTAGDWENGDQTSIAPHHDLVNAMLQTWHGLQQRSPFVKLARRSTVAAENRQGAWRKEMGVEPTGDRMAAPSGFEDQPPHRRRFPSSTFSINDLTATAAVLMTPSVQRLSNWGGHGILPEEIKQVASTGSQARNQADHQALSPSHPRRKPGTTDRQSIGCRPLHQPRPGQTRHISGLARV